MFKLRRVPFDFDTNFELRQPPAAVVVAAHSIWREISRTYDPKAPITNPIEAADDLRYQAVTVLCTVYSAHGTPVLASLIDEHNRRAGNAPALVNDTPEAADKPVGLSSAARLLPSFSPESTVADILDHLDMQEVFLLLSLCLNVLSEEWITSCVEEAAGKGILSLLPKKKPETK